MKNPPAMQEMPVDTGSIPGLDQIPTAAPQRKKNLHFTAEKTNAQRGSKPEPFPIVSLPQFNSSFSHLTLHGNYSFTHLTPEAIFEAVYTVGTQ